MKKVSFLVLAILVLLIGGCDLFNNSTGSIQLTVEDNISSKTLLPDIDMKISSFDIHGEGPDGATFDLTDVTDLTIEIDSLAFGDWTITVYAKNADGTIIGQGEGSGTVHSGEVTVIIIVVVVLEGEGTIDLTVNWNVEDTEFPAIESKIIPADPDLVPIDPAVFTITGGNQGTYVNDEISTGYHTVIVKLLDNGLLTMGAVEVARIVKDEVTYGVFNFDNINPPGGIIQLNIIPDMDDVIDVTLSGGVPQITTLETMTLTASVPADVANVTYVWYINGDSVYVGDNITDPSYTVAGLAVGTYRLDVTAITPAGDRAGSTTHDFTVVEDGGDLSGRVGWMDGATFTPLENATVTAGGVMTQTDAGGNFTLTSIASLNVTIEASMTRYLTGYRNATVIAGINTNVGDIVLMPISEVRFPSNEAITLTSLNGDTSISFAANSFENEDGDAYSGEVIARMNGIIPDEPGFDDTFPGDFSGIRTDGTEVDFISWGFVYTELFASDGTTRLRVRQGVSVSFRVPDPANADPTIPTWAFNPATGLWNENGRAQLTDDGRYEAQIEIIIIIIIIINVDKPRL